MLLDFDILSIIKHNRATAAVEIEIGKYKINGFIRRIGG